MKVVKQTTPNKESVSLDFLGIVEDNEKDLWLFTNDGAIFLTDFSGDLIAIEEVIRDYGPFTKFTGSVTISN